MYDTTNVPCTKREHDLRTEPMQGGRVLEVCHCGAVRGPYVPVGVAT